MDEGNTFLQEARFLSYLILTTRYDLDEQIRNDILVFVPWNSILFNPSNHILFLLEEYT